MKDNTKLIWKEFFRLKKEEITGFLTLNTEVPIYTSIYMFFLVILGIGFLILFLYIIGFLYITFFGNEEIRTAVITDKSLYAFIGILMTIILIIISFLIKLFIYNPIIWLHSNWKLAKSNIESKEIIEKYYKMGE